MYSLLYFEDGYLQYITSPKYSKEYKNRYVGKLASENLARIWRASIERRATLPACGSCLTGASLRAPLRLRSALAACACLSAWTRSRRSRRSHCGWSESGRHARLHTATANSRQRGASTPLFNA